MAPRIGGLATLFALVVSLGLAVPGVASAATYTDHDGHTIEVEAQSLPPDAARDRAFVDLLGSLVHSSEMDGITVRLTASPDEQTAACGGGFVACVYGSTIALPGWRSAQEQRIVIAHEYGHIIHSARDNPPRGSLSDGPKRWASYEGICQGLRSGEYGGSYYARPREAFAQAYATLNFSDTPWGDFVESLRPDEGAFEAIRQDIFVPWEPTLETIKGRIGKTNKSTHELSLPLDGILSLALTTARGLKAKLALTVGGEKIKRNRLLDYEICGERAATLVIKARKHTTGRFKLAIQRP